jgi:hypothetical protein
MYKYGDYERKKRAEKLTLERSKFIQGVIMAPILMLGWFPLVWIISKAFEK